MLAFRCFFLHNFNIRYLKICIFSPISVQMLHTFCYGVLSNYAMMLKFAKIVDIYVYVSVYSKFEKLNLSQICFA